MSFLENDLMRKARREEVTGVACSGRVETGLSVRLIPLDLKRKKTRIF
jgi:hypothetical protein